MPTETASPAASQLHQLRFARGATLRLLDGIPADKRCVQPAIAGGAALANHATWIVGHLASTEDFFLAEFSGGTPALSEKWRSLFGGGSTPVDDPAAYPPFEEVMRTFEERREALTRWFESLTVDQIAEPAPEKWRPYAPTLGDLAPFLAYHEGYHGGQLAVARKACGLSPAFG
jgi:uncharacterized damage-inducible protein DinB